MSTLHYYKYSQIMLSIPRFDAKKKRDKICCYLSPAFSKDASKNGNGEEGDHNEQSKKAR